MSVDVSGADQDRFPARVHVLLARDSPRALVIRRGPAKQVCFIGWDRHGDRFTPTQWLRGRIYEYRADLSPSGEYIIYFAMNGHWDSESKGAWTAVSKWPWMKAVAFYPKGNCWHGGGLFIDRFVYWLNNGMLPHDVAFEDRLVHRDANYEPDSGYGGECPHVYYNRLQRDGWVIVDTWRKKTHGRRATVFEKPLSRGWVLRKIACVGSPMLGRGCYWDEHELITPAGTVRDHPDWAWADYDGERLFWVSQGCLYAREVLGRKRLGPMTCLHNFNPMTFERNAAPY